MTNDIHEFDVITTLLDSHQWVFAKTMPENPHEYSLRKNWNDDEFVRVVQYIRKYGYEKPFKGRNYTQLDVGDHFYWTMGSPMSNTTLINRKKLGQL